MKIIENNTKHEYMVINIPYVKKNLEHFRKASELAFKRFKFSYGKNSTTAFYRYYNSVSLCVGSVHYYNLFKDLYKFIRKFSKNKKPLWCQCWLNIHKEHELLKWHNHPECLYHGYISIDPKDTQTIFKNYIIKNKPGNIYIGPSGNYHKVKSNSSYRTPRITLGFDVIDQSALYKLYNKYGEVDINTGFLPVY